MPDHARVELDHLVVFLAVAETRSFSKAAARLGVGKGTVSRVIAALEARLGTELVHRTTQRVGLSTAGSALYARAAPHLAALGAAIGEVADADTGPSGVLRIAAPNDFGVVVLPDLLAAFSALHPAIRYDVRLGPHRADLVADGFDLAFRASAGPLQDSSLTMRRLGVGTAAAYASPAYLARHGHPATLGDPGHAWLVHVAVPSRLASLGELGPAVLADDFFLLRDLAVRGLGVVLLPTLLAAPHVAAGDLEAVRPATAFASTANLFLLYPSSGTLPRKVTAFRDFALDWFKRTPLG